MISERVIKAFGQVSGDGCKCSMCAFQKALANVIAACEQVLNEGNMAAQGHWDATDKMKTLAFEALAALDAALKECE
jgi:hypothetical protein